MFVLLLQVTLTSHPDHLTMQSPKRAITIIRIFDYIRRFSNKTLIIRVSRRQCLRDLKLTFNIYSMFINLSFAVDYTSRWLRRVARPNAWAAGLMASRALTAASLGS